VYGQVSPLPIENLAKPGNPYDRSNPVPFTPRTGQV
jgi:hypothetical protein